MQEVYDKLEPLSRVVMEQEARDIAREFGTPVHVYSQRLLEQQADKALAFPNPFGLTVRYAMKSNPNANISRIFHNKGIAIDSSSEFEVYRAIAAGIPPASILLTAQEPAKNLRDLVQRGVDYNACSLYQLEYFGELFPGREVSIRVNPGLGSGGTNRTNTGGPSSSFGSWHEYLNEIFRIAKNYGLRIKRVHTHIGSGSDPEVWQKVAGMSLDIVERVLDAGHNVSILNLGGGYKVGRMSYEPTVDLQEIGKPVAEQLRNFEDKKGVKLRLEIEPGTFLVANAGCVIARAVDVKKTPEYNFIITDTGMTEIPRPALYGAQHPISVIPADMNLDKSSVHFIVSGHECESGSILTPGKGEPEALLPRRLLRACRGDLVVIGGTGAYCSGMCNKNYNSFPEAPEVLITNSGKLNLIRKRQTLEQMTQNEIRVIS